MEGSMTNYIDVEKLKAEIEKRAKFHDDAIKACVGLNDIAITHSAGWKEDTELLTIINSLQQEQSEVNFKVEERKWVHDAVDNVFPEDGDFMSEVDFRKILKDTARHFYELGRKGGSK